MFSEDPNSGLLGEMVSFSVGEAPFTDDIVRLVMVLLADMSVSLLGMPAHSPSLKPLPQEGNPGGARVGLGTQSITPGRRCMCL